MVTYGLDLSHYQSLNLDLAQCRREGVEFIFIKSTEGSSFVDPAFADRLAKARAAGMLVAAYHYVRDNATAAAQVANVARVVPKDVPVIPDVEANSGGVALVREFVRLLTAAGYRVPLLYLPRWYWQQIGSPSLAGLPSLWSSRYPDNIVRSLTDGLGKAPASYWDGYGGLGVTVLQFSSSGRVAGYQPLDVNAYKGTLDQLAAVLGQQEEEVDLNTDQNNALAETWETIVSGGKWQGTNLQVQLGFIVGEQRRMHAETLSAIASGDLDPASLVERMAAAAHDGAAEATERAINTTVLPALRAVVGEVLGEDNKAQADAIVDALATRLTNPEGK